jgi:spore germination protein GerM
LRLAAAGGLVLAAGLIGWLLFSGLPRWYETPGADDPAGTPAAASADPERRITVRLFYVAEDGRSLTTVEREVPFAEGPTEQAREIVRAQLAPPAPPLVSPIPAGTTLRAVFVTGNGGAFLDLSREIASAHPGGSTNELLTIYALVNALTVNLPAIDAVQLLVDGKEVDTLAGHAELRRPLVQNLAWVR